MSNRTIYFAIPAMNEKEFLPFTLDCIDKQRYKANIKVYVCVNQPEKCWENEQIEICKNNQQTIELLKNYSHLDITLIDKSSRGNGWEDKKQGVGHARKLLIDSILQVASDNDILISMDADTVFEADYCQTVADNFQAHKGAVGLAVPYYHRLINSEPEDRAILRYELYTRNYNLNLLRIGSPYAYTALGSAIACTIKACKAVGGFDAYTSGEDFYFLQKLCKHGNILRYNKSKVYPATRYSARVPFGTGPAMQKGSLGNWKPYPIFDYSGFDVIEQTYKMIGHLFYEDVDNEFIRFLKTVFSTDDLWSALRKNYKTISSFTRAFHNKADGLKIFQFLRYHQSNCQKSDEKCLSDFFKQYYPHISNAFSCRMESFSFSSASIRELDEIRNFLMEQETGYQIIYNQ